jgi:hypothetical protein
MKRLIYIVLFLPLCGFGQGFLLNPYAFSSAVYEPEYQAVLDRATVLGYTLPSASVQVKQNTLVAALKANGVWSQLDVFYVFANDGSAQFATLNWVNPNNFQCTLVNAPNFTTNQGFAGNGSTSYINTNWNPSANGVKFTLNDASAGVWQLQNTEGLREIFGCGDGVNAVSTLWNRNSGRYVRINSSAHLAPASNLTNVGFNFIDRPSSTTMRVYSNGTLFASNTIAASVLINFNMYILGTNVSGVLSGPTADRVSVFFAGASLGANATSFYNSLNTYVTSL